MQNVLGLDIGGTKCAVLLGGYDGETFVIHKKAVLPTDPAASPQVMFEALCHKADELLEETALDAIGISCGGPLDPERGIIQRPPNLPLWDEIPLTEWLHKRYRVPARLQNDADACALAEWKLGAGRGARNLVFLTFGTGLGAGLILNGQLYQGSRFMAGEVGHIRLAEEGPAGFGKDGSFEGFCSGGGLAQLGYTLSLAQHQRGNTPPFFWPGQPQGGITAKVMAEAAEQGDPTAQEIYRRCGRYLGRGLSVLIDILNPDCIVLGSIFARSEMLLRPEMERVLAEETLPASLVACRIVPAALGESLGDYAALVTAVAKET